jgi:hypothetical protein
MDTHGSLQIRASQNCFATPACLSTALAVCLDKIFPVHGETSLRDGTLPDFVVTFAWPFKVAAMRAKHLLHARGVTGHPKVRMPLYSCWYST